MKKDIKNSLAQTNAYLRNKDKRQAALVASVCSSSAIEGIDAYRIMNLPVFDQLLLQKNNDGAYIIMDGIEEFREE